MLAVGFNPRKVREKRFSSRSDRSCARGVGRAGCVGGAILGVLAAWRAKNLTQRRKGAKLGSDIMQNTDGTDDYRYAPIP